MEPTEKPSRKRKKTPKTKRIDIFISPEGYALVEKAAALGEEGLKGYARRVLLAQAREDVARAARGTRGVGNVAEGATSDRKKPASKSR